MNAYSSDFLINLLSKSKIYKYYLVIKFLQKYYPELQYHYVPIKKTVIKEWKQKPYVFLTIAFISGVILGAFIKKHI